MKPTGEAVAARAVALATGTRISYNELDCQAYVEKCVNDCGGSLAAAGSNDMVRNHCAWLGTLANAQAEGKLVPGAALLIHEDDESGLPAKYRGDGLGDFSHVGLYVGEGALTDADKSGKARSCNVVHSSASMGRVAGSTTRNGWTHVMLFQEIAYGMGTGGLTLGTSAEKILNEGEAAAGESAMYVRVQTANGMGVHAREKPSRSAIYKYTIPEGTRLRVMGESGQYYKIMYNGSPRYVAREFVVIEAPQGGANAVPATLPSAARASEQPAAQAVASQADDAEAVCFTVTIPGLDAATATCLLETYAGASAIEEATNG